MRIRDDFAGSVYAATSEGVVVLVAGQTVPSGVRVDPALVVEDQPAVKRGGSRARKSE